MTQSTETATTLRETLHFVGGEWVASSDGATFDVADPFTGETVVHAAAGTRDDARRASRRRPQRSPAWAATPPAVRQAIFLKAADVLESRTTRSSTCSRARPAAPSASACSRCTSSRALRQAAGVAYAPIGEVIPSDVPGAFAMGLRQPVGVVGAIAPWNAALILSARSIAAPLALGNTVVLKPSDGRRSPAACSGARSSPRPGCPPGVLNIVTHAPGEAAGSATSSSRTPPFAGSTSPARPPTGRRSPRLRAAPEARRPRARRLEPADRARRRRPRLRGRRRSFGVVPAPGADLHVDAPDLRRARDRGRVHRAARRQGRGLKVGDPEEHDTIIGPLINGQALSTVAARVQDAVDRGARCSSAARPTGPATGRRSLTDVPADSAVRARGDIRTGRRRSSSWRTPTHTSTWRTPPATGSQRGSSRVTSERGFELAAGSRQASSTSTTRLSATSRRCLRRRQGLGLGRFGSRAAMEEFTETQWVTVQARERTLPVLRRGDPGEETDVTASTVITAEEAVAHDQFRRHRDGRRLRPRRRPADPDRRARRALRCDGPHDRLEQHRRARSWARQAAAPGSDQAWDLVVLHLEPRGRRGGERGRDRGDAHAPGTFAEAIRAGGAGIGGFYTPVGAGTLLADGKEERTHRRRPTCARTSRFAPTSRSSSRRGRTRSATSGTGGRRATSIPLMATAARVTIAEAGEIVPVGGARARVGRDAAPLHRRSGGAA